MSRISFAVDTDVSHSLRANQVCSMFDAPLEAKCAKAYDLDFPWDEQPWNVGLVVGPSGSGKSTVARHIWGTREPLRWDGAGIVDDFPEGMSTEQIANAVNSVGFSTPPAWLRPHRVLSMGEQFRAEVARRMMGDEDPIVVDEYTSVVDRQVAQVASHAIQRYVRAQKRRFVAVGCHYDVIDWLQPDWILDMATQQFTRRLLQRRPPIEIVIGRLPRAAWGMFAPFHYMTAELPPATHGFGLWANGQLAVSSWLAVFPHPKVRDIVRCARLVTLPDYQGIGLINPLQESLGAALKAGGRRMRIYPAHPMLIDKYKRQGDRWQMVQDQAFGSQTSATSSGNRRGGDRCIAVFEYCGPPNARFASQLGVQRTLSGEDGVSNVVDFPPQSATDMRPGWRPEWKAQSAPQLSATRIEAQEAIAALKRGESVDFYALAVRTGLDILAHGEDKDRATALKFFAPTIKGIDAPKPAEVDDGAAELVSERRNRLAAARDALARGDVEATRTALEGLTDMLDALRVGKAGGA